MSPMLSSTALLGSCLCLVLNAWQGACIEWACPVHRPQSHELRSILRDARERNRPYQAPSLAELEKMHAAARALLRELTAGRFQDSGVLFKGAGFDLVQTVLGGAPALAVQESAAHRRGGGVYIFRRGAVPRERIVQIPHSFFDLGTLELGVELADMAQARALFVNTVHRYQGGPPPSRDHDEAESSPADLAHQELSIFQGLTHAALEALPRVQLIQLHGFADRSVADCANAEVVVSPGTAAAGAAEAVEVAARLGELLGADHVLLHPRDTQRLGGRTNVQGRAVATTGEATFLHLELSRTLRNRLLRDPGLRRSFFAAVLGPRKESP
jgi:hypothetical protein